MCTTCEKYELRTADTVTPGGPVAQPGRAPHWQCGSRGFKSLLVHSLIISPYALGGLVAGEGCFCITRKLPPFADGSTRLSFRFQVTMASRDRPLLEALRDHLGYGSIHDTRPQRATWQPTSTFTIGSLTAHHAATIPFSEQYLLPGAKRRQFERWRDAMLAYETAKPNPFGRGRAICSVPGCGKFVRGRGLCRSHYYRATGY